MKSYWWLVRPEEAPTQLLTWMIMGRLILNLGKNTLSYFFSEFNAMKLVCEFYMAGLGILMYYTNQSRFVSSWCSSYKLCLTNVWDTCLTLQICKEMSTASSAVTLVWISSYPSLAMKVLHFKSVHCYNIVSSDVYLFYLFFTI